MKINKKKIQEHPIDDFWPEFMQKNIFTVAIRS